MWLWNSTLAAVGSVALSMSVSVLAGYSLSRFSVRGGHSLGLFILTAKMLPATLLVIPLFGIFRTLGLIGSLWSIILAHSTLIIPFTTWMLKGYFDTIPRELEQAAMVDGCSPIGALVRVILPVATPGLAATALYGFVLSWSDYAYARTFLTNAQSNWTANLGITTMKGEYVTDWNEISAASIFVALPDHPHLPVPRTLSGRRPDGRRGEMTWPASASRTSASPTARSMSSRTSRWTSPTASSSSSSALPAAASRRCSKSSRDSSRPAAAAIFIGDRDVTDLAPGDRDIAMVFQNYALYPHLTVRRNIGFGLKMRGTPAAEIERRVADGRQDPRRRPPARPPARRPCRAASASASRWAARSCASRRPS